MPKAKTFQVIYRPAPLTNGDNNIPIDLLSEHSTLDEANRAAKAFLLNYLTSLDKSDFFGIDQFIRETTSPADNREKDDTSGKKVNPDELSTLDLVRKYDNARQSSEKSEHRHEEETQERATDQQTSNDDASDKNKEDDTDGKWECVEFESMQHFFAHMDDMRASPDSRRMEMVQFHHCHDLQEDKVVFRASVQPWYMEPPGAGFLVQASTEEVSIQELIELDPRYIEFSLRRSWQGIVKVYDELPESATAEVLATKLRRTTFAMTQRACFILPSLHRLLIAFGAKVIKMSELQHAKGDVFAIRAAQEPLNSYNLILKYKPKMVLHLREAESLILWLMFKLRHELEYGQANTSEKATTSKQIRAEIELEAPEPAADTPAGRSRRLTSAALSPWNPGEKRKEPHDEQDDAATLAHRVKETQERAKEASSVMQKMVVRIAEVEEDDAEDV